MKKLLVFTHIEKAAGTSLIHILRRNFLFRYCDVRPLFPHQADEVWKPVFDREDLRAYLRINPFLTCIASHSISPATDFSGLADMTYVTILRDPVARYVSQYFYSKEMRDKQWGFEQFLDIEGNHNFQVKKIAGSDDIELAKEILRERFLAVGVVEKFDEFLVYLRRVISRDFNVKYRQMNVRPSSEGVKRLVEEYGDAIRQRNEKDSELYHFVLNVVIPERREFVQEDICKDSLFKISRLDSFLMGGRNALDYTMRKGYLEPVSGVIRRKNGLPARGSY